MCVAYPGRVIEVKEHSAVVDFTGTRVEAASGIMKVEPGDRVLVHAGCIIQKLPEEEADEIESVFAELAALEAEDMAAIERRRRARGLSV
ncbi:MAG: HypC/HybG/HupF family hydrogenase formation chaperone [Lachnospiraceae bacterium]|nr:HypC/HybG/HupF family hydrogenase formation chaperone [Lachnospiraceae bacterium]